MLLLFLKIAHMFVSLNTFCINFEFSKTDTSSENIFSISLFNSSIVPGKMQHVLSLLSRDNTVLPAAIFCFVLFSL